MKLVLFQIHLSILKQWVVGDATQNGKMFMNSLISESLRIEKYLRAILIILFIDTVIVSIWFAIDLWEHFKFNW